MAIPARGMEMEMVRILALRNIYVRLTRFIGIAGNGNVGSGMLVAASRS